MYLYTYRESRPIHAELQPWIRYSHPACDQPTHRPVNGTPDGRSRGYPLGAQHDKLHTTNTRR